MYYKARELHFYGHETFPLRHLWLPKAINHIREDHNLSDSFSVMAEQGLGKNMAKSMRHWAESTKVVDKTRRGNLITYTISNMGDLIFSDKGDRYLQYSDTIWLLHYLMVTNHKKNVLCLLGTSAAGKQKAYEKQSKHIRKFGFTHTALFKKTDL